MNKILNVRVLCIVRKAWDINVWGKACVCGTRYACGTRHACGTRYVCGEKHVCGTSHVCETRHVCGTRQGMGVGQDICVGQCMCGTRYVYYGLKIYVGHGQIFGTRYMCGTRNGTETGWKCDLKWVTEVCCKFWLHWRPPEGIHFHWRGLKKCFLQFKTLRRVIYNFTGGIQISFQGVYKPFINV